MTTLPNEIWDMIAYHSSKPDHVYEIEWMICSGNNYGKFATRFFSGKDKCQVAKYIVKHFRSESWYEGMIEALKIDLLGTLSSNRDESNNSTDEKLLEIALKPIIIHPTL